MTAVITIDVAIQSFPADAVYYLTDKNPKSTAPVTKPSSQKVSK
jgi:hypothetical protein